MCVHSYIHTYVRTYVRTYNTNITITTTTTTTTTITTTLPVIVKPMIILTTMIMITNADPTLGAESPHPDII